MYGALCGVTCAALDGDARRQTESAAVNDYRLTTLITPRAGR